MQIQGRQLTASIGGFAKCVDIRFGAADSSGLLELLHNFLSWLEKFVRSIGLLGYGVKAMLPVGYEYLLAIGQFQRTCSKVQTNLGVKYWVS